MKLFEQGLMMDLVVSNFFLNFQNEYPNAIPPHGIILYPTPKIRYDFVKNGVIPILKNNPLNL